VMTQRQQAPVSSDDALFRSLDDGRFVATQWARGPWNPAHCHGAPPSALLTRMIESIDDGEWQLARITIELQRPVPVAEPLTASCEIERPGSTISIASSSLNVGGVTVARARALRMRVFDGQSPNVPHQIQPMPADAASSQEIVPTFITDDIAYASDSCEYRFARGAWGDHGAADVWIRLRLPLLAGEAVSPAQRVAAAADFGNGVSAGVDHLTWLYINPDLTIHLARRATGDWIGLSARSEYGDSGAGVACSHLHDALGPIGVSAQSLLVEPR